MKKCYIFDTHRGSLSFQLNCLSVVFFFYDRETRAKTVWIPPHGWACNGDQNELKMVDPALYDCVHPLSQNTPDSLILIFKMMLENVTALTLCQFCFYFVLFLIHLSRIFSGRFFFPQMCQVNTYLCMERLQRLNSQEIEQSLASLLPYILPLLWMLDLYFYST